MPRWSRILRGAGPSSMTERTRILTCALCAGRMRVVSVIEEGPVARKILDHLGLPSEPPVRASARDPPDPELPLPLSTDARHPLAGA